MIIGSHGHDRFLDLLGTPRAIAWRIVFDKNVLVGVRRFLSTHELLTFEQTGWPPQLDAFMEMRLPARPRFAK